MLEKKYNYIETEEKWKKFWEEHGIYKFDEKSEKPVYAVDTPPPYVSAEHLHAGHIMSYSQAEFVVRFKRMKGFNVYYPMGFDDNGLPTERFVEKKHNVDKSSISRSEFIKLCLKETAKGAENYKKLWRDLGISVDWSKTYSTINRLCQKVSQWSFVDLYKKGKVYRKKEPTVWCPFCQTALAQADMEHKEVSTKLNYIKVKIGEKFYEIATTRPELLAACVAIFAHPDDKRFSHLQMARAEIPFFDHKVPVLFDKRVDPKFGTGLMMVCTWGDFEDIEKLRDLELGVREALDVQGRMSPIAGEYEGMKAEEARAKIIQDLQKADLLIKQEPLTHTLNAHERCGTPVEFILATQWFVNVLDIKDALLKRGEELRWFPKEMQQIYNNWVNGLKWDWCISRQRYYGVPFPVWYCKKCGEAVIQEENLPVDPIEASPPISKCAECGCSDFEPETDVMDTWATSSCTPFIIQKLVDSEETKAQIFPNSLRPQAFEIIRTWLFYSVLKSHYHFDKLPFKDAMISGHGLDKDGKKISKRLGNYIPPDQLLQEYGADAIRYWAAGATLGANHRFTIEEVRKGKYLVNKLWNAARLCSMHLQGFDFKKMDKEELEPEDRWIFHKLNLAIKEITESFESYEYAKARDCLDKFFWKDFCDYYLEIVKHRVSEETAKFTLYTVLFDILCLYAPILPFITEELYQGMFKQDGGEESIHLHLWPEYEEQREMNEEALKQMEFFIQEIDSIRKEKSEKGLSMREELADYTPKTKIDIPGFGEKLEKMLSVSFS